MPVVFTYPRKVSHYYLIQLVHSTTGRSRLCYSLLAYGTAGTYYPIDETPTFLQHHLPAAPAAILLRVPK